MGSRWRATASLLLNHITTKAFKFLSPNLPRPIYHSHPLTQTVCGFKFRSFSAIPSRVSVYSNEIESGSHDLAINYDLGPKEDEESGKIPVKAYFLCTRSATSFLFFLLFFSLMGFVCSVFFEMCIFAVEFYAYLINYFLGGFLLTQIGGLLCLHAKFEQLLLKDFLFSC
jgi:hypothetical protein